MNKDEMKQRLKDRTQRSAVNTGKKGLGKKTALDFSVVNRSIELYTMKGGTGVKNELDILPFEVTQDWYANLKEPNRETLNGLIPGSADYKLEYCVHRNMGDASDTILCLQNTFGRKCPICIDARELWDIEKEKRTTNQQKKLEYLTPSWRNTYNIFDYAEPDKDIQLWDNVSYKLFEEKLKLRIQNDDEGLRTFSDYEEGLTVVFEGEPRTLGTNTFFEAAQFSFNERNPWPWETFKEVFPLDQMLPIPTYDEVHEIYKSLAPPDTDSQDDQPPGGRRDRNRSTAGQADPQSAQKTCQAGHILGDDREKFDDCNKCSEEEFQECAFLSGTPTGAQPAGEPAGEPAAGEPGGEPWPTGDNQPAQDQPPTTTTRTRTRTRGVDANAGDQPAGSEASATRTRTRGNAAPATDTGQPGTGVRRTRTRG